MSVPFNLSLVLDSNQQCVTQVQTQVGEDVTINATILENSVIKTNYTNLAIEFYAIIKAVTGEKFKVEVKTGITPDSNGVISINNSSLTSVAGCGTGEICLKDADGKYAISNPFKIVIKATNKDDVGQAMIDTNTTYAEVLEMLTAYNAGSLGGMTDEQAEQLETNTSNIASLSSQLAALTESGGTVTGVEPATMDIPRIYLSSVNGSTLPTTKTSTTMKFKYVSKSKQLDGYVDIKCQGNSSMSYPKKNFTIKLYSDVDKTTKQKVDFKGWGKQNKFVLKANWIDITHSLNVVGARLWGQVVKSRAGYDSIPELLRTSPNQGAVDGFPVMLYNCGKYWGRYTLNIPKDAWMSNMDDELDTHCILCGENYYSGCFLQSATINGSDWTDELHDTVPTSIVTRWNQVITAVKDSTDANFIANLNSYIDVESAIDYYIFGVVSCGLDAFGKNQLYFTYDGQKWYAGMYDMDSTWGLWWNGASFVATNYARSSFQDMVQASDCPGTGNKLYVRLESLFTARLKQRYTALRNSILSAENIISEFEKFWDICPNDLIEEDYASTTGDGAFTNIPSKASNTKQRIRAYIVDRLTYCDTYINGLTGNEVACTGIALSASSLTFTSTATQTLTATLTPANTTDVLTWTSSDTSKAIVSGGIVTPVANGTCTITATCGSQTATCSVTISGVNICTINNTLTNCTNSNSASSVEKNSSYTGTLTASSGYELGTPTITMGGTDITSSCYTASTGIISIASVTGNVIITCTASEITYPCTNITLSANVLTFTNTTPQTLTATLTPANTTDTLTWTSSDETKATVSNGVVTPVANGTCTITATCGSKTATCAVTLNGNFNLLYEITTPTTFNGTAIDTNICMFNSDNEQDYSIFIDFTQGTTQNSASSSVFVCSKSTNPWNGLNFQYDTSLRFNLASGAGCTNYIDSIVPSMKCVIITDKANSKIKYYDISGTLTEFNGNFTTYSGTLLIGNLWYGNINSFKLYKNVLTSSEINELLGVDSTETKHEIISSDAPYMPNGSKFILYNANFDINNKTMYFDLPTVGSQTATYQTLLAVGFNIDKWGKNNVQFGYNTATSGTNTLVQIHFGPAGVVSAANTTTIDCGTHIKIAFNSNGFYINGNKITVTGTGIDNLIDSIAVAGSRIEVGSTEGASRSYATYSEFSIYNSLKTESEMIALTTVSE